ncbi:T-cell immunomodulatory protein-like [Lineus longissimus]|uniref:T-cell immunomodulatory protein-like n=1 Tax=Lineus longissimus TaxID=88925 RepID=UPI002B4F71D0
MAKPSWNFSIFSYLFYLFLALFIHKSRAELSDVTGYLLDDVNEGELAGFGDFNSDKTTDLFVISQSGKDVILIIAAKEGQYKKKLLIDLTKHVNGTTITSVMPGDFDGDSQMDVLITTSTSPKNLNVPVSVLIYWGKREGFVVENKPLVIDTKMRQQPLVMDYNADMIPDLLGEESSSGKRYYWIASNNRSFTRQEVVLPNNGTLLPMRIPHSNAFIDLDNDLNPDLFVTSYDKASKKQIFELWYNEIGSGGWTLNGTLEPPQTDAAFIGQAVFTDINADKKMDILLPICSDANCAESGIYAYSEGNWTLMISKFMRADKTYKFLPPGMAEEQPITLRVGDYNLDGYPDVVTVLQTEDNGEKKQQAFILYNYDCKAASCKRLGRTFFVDYGAPLSSVKDAITVAFFDIYENGILDIFVTSRTKKGTDVHAFLHGFALDACFMKVTVVSGLCYHDCGQNSPYGTDQPGPTVSYETTRTDGTTQVSVAGQLSQSAYMSLQLPYTVFGLGISPNFVDSMEVGIPTPADSTSVRKKKWTSIIPNSQLIVIPHPSDDPSSWYNKLFIAPMANKQVLYTAAALLGTCGLVAIVSGVLQWRERAEDKKEKLVDAQKFHFDAM